MSEISSDTRRGILEISSYDGSSGIKEDTLLHNHLKYSKYDSEWEFSRERNNHAYTTEGNVSYREGCSNNLLISSHGKVRLINVKNAFIFLDDSHVEISPIFSLSDVIYRAARKLTAKNIRYHIPELVLKRENLLKKDPYKIEEELKKRYDIKSKKISLIPSRSKMGGIYFIEEKDGHKSVLKYRSIDKEHAETLSMTVANLPGYFPKIFSRVDSPGYTFDMQDGFYGLEEFIEGPLKERNLDYFSSLGSHISQLHKQFSLFLQNNHGLESVFLREGYVNESSIASIYLDLKTNKENIFLLSELEKIISDSLLQKINSLPKSLIHNDLNNSNLIWVKESPKIIDPESIGISVRINEFVAPLFLGGNRNRPAYVEGSLFRLISSYNESSINPLSDKEGETLIDLLKYAFLRYYVIRSIRRGMNEINYLDETKRTLKRLEGEFSENGK